MWDAHTGCQNTSIDDMIFLFIVLCNFYLIPNPAKANMLFENEILEPKQSSTQDR